MVLPHCVSACTTHFPHWSDKDPAEHPNGREVYSCLCFRDCRASQGRRQGSYRGSDLALCIFASWWTEKDKLSGESLNRGTSAPSREPGADILYSSWDILLLLHQSHFIEQSAFNSPSRVPWSQQFQHRSAVQSLLRLKTILNYCWVHRGSGPNNS